MPGGMERARLVTHLVAMAKDPTPKNRDRSRTFIRAWRKARGYSLETAVERLGLEAEFPYSVGQLSRVERNEAPYQQDLLEALATVYRCEPQDLLGRDPQADEESGPFAGMSQDEIDRAMQVIALIRPTGTGG